MDLAKQIDKPGREGLIRLKLPLPYPLRYVNCYLVEGPDGWTVIDPGLHTPETEALWEVAMSQLGLSSASIKQIILTHHHPDHYGMAGWLQGKTDAPVRMSAKGWEQADHMWGKGRLTDSDAVLALFQQHGMESSLLAGMKTHLLSSLPQVTPHPQVTVMESDTEIQMGGDAWQVMETNGHAWGHLCFYQPRSRELFCGDHVLPRIYPNISYMPGTDDNPLASYLEALKHVAKLKPLLAYPGHRDPFTNFGERTEQLLHHHAQRLERIAAMVDEPIHVYDISRGLFGSALALANLRFAMAETLAHLIYLEQAGRIERDESHGVIMFKATDNSTSTFPIKLPSN
ncbi:MAG: MBL fold metallo-hydrolase [Gorillibacterium sp.]|nr:MBL fold metallo-hydrolase [Gorillibacterium sp.]